MSAPSFLGAQTAVLLDEKLQYVELSVVLSRRDTLWLSDFKTRPVFIGHMMFKVLKFLCGSFYTTADGKCEIKMHNCSRSCPPMQAWCLCFWRMGYWCPTSWPRWPSSSPASVCCLHWSAAQRRSSDWEPTASCFSVSPSWTWPALSDGRSVWCFIYVLYINQPPRNPNIITWFICGLLQVKYVGRTLAAGKTS